MKKKEQQSQRRSSDITQNGSASGSEASVERARSRTGRRLKGIVVSDKMHKTAIVAVVRMRLHPKYKKRYRSTRRFKAHDEENIVHVGEEVVIEETRPLSKDKRWRVVEKASKAEAVSRVAKKNETETSV